MKLKTTANSADGAVTIVHDLPLYGAVGIAEGSKASRAWMAWRSLGGGGYPTCHQTWEETG
jgi:hypothetical protein